MSTAIAITRDNKGSAVSAILGTSLSVDISAATVGAVIYVAVCIASTQTSVTATAGWTAIANTDVNTTHYSIWWRAKQPGDTTFTVTWASSGQATLVWSSYLGVNPTQPHELVSASLYTSSTSTLTTPTQTPNGSDRWGLSFFTAENALTFTANLSGVSSVISLISGIGLFAAAVVGDTLGAVSAVAQSFNVGLSLPTLSGTATQAFLVPGFIPPPTPYRQSLWRSHLF